MNMYKVYYIYILYVLLARENIHNTGVSTSPAQADIWVTIAFYIQKASSTLGFWTQQETVLATVMYIVNI